MSKLIDKGFAPDWTEIRSAAWIQRELSVTVEDGVLLYRREDDYLLIVHIGTDNGTKIYRVHCYNGRDPREAFKEAAALSVFESHPQVVFLRTDEHGWTFYDHCQSRQEAERFVTNMIEDESEKIQRWCIIPRESWEQFAPPAWASVHLASDRPAFHHTSE